MDDIVTQDGFSHFEDGHMFMRKGKAICYKTDRKTWADKFLHGLPVEATYKVPSPIDSVVPIKSPVQKNSPPGPVSIINPERVKRHNKKSLPTGPIINPGRPERRSSQGHNKKKRFKMNYQQAHLEKYDINHEGQYYYFPHDSGSCMLYESYNSHTQYICLGKCGRWGCQCN